MTDYTSDYKSGLLKLDMFPLMLLYEYYDIIFFFKCLKSPSSAFDISHFLQLPQDLLPTSSSTTIKIIAVISISIAFLVYGTLFLFLLSIYCSPPSSSNSRMLYGQNSNLTSMPAIHALFIICAHVETAQCHSLLYTHNFTQAVNKLALTSPSESPYLPRL